MEKGMLDQGAQAAHIAQQPTEKSQAVESTPEEAMTGLEEEATEEEQAAYEEAMNELQYVLYENEETSNALIEMVHPDDLVQSTAKTVIQLVTQMDEKVNFEESSIYSITEQSVDRLTELVENSKGVQYSDKDIQKIMMTSWEAILGIFGGDEEIAPVYQEMVAGVDDKLIRQAQQKYVEMQNG